MNVLNGLVAIPASTRARQFTILAPIDKMRKRDENAVVMGYDLRRELQRLGAMKHLGPACSWYTLHVKYWTRVPKTYYGYCSYRRRVIQINVWPGVTLAEVVSTLVHEAVHASALPGHNGHSMRFARLLAGAFESRWGIDSSHQLHGRSAWRKVEKFAEGCLMSLGPEWLQEYQMPDDVAVRVAKRKGPFEGVGATDDGVPNRTQVRAYCKWVFRHMRGIRREGYDDGNGGFRKGTEWSGHFMDWSDVLKIAQPGESFEIHLSYADGGYYSDVAVYVPRTRGAMVAEMAAVV